ncbi:phage portal, SPP1 Gp6-like family protein [Clostridioides difficile CD200]|uniref:phage portal protein n=1 Tax=Clostridioides difficile TaxID=1496 RepID=UPI00038D5CF2|nr:phage portal protein [Clostridioides difficile]EQF59271.1 phage portal, SPP1 Gp6-like family protein [Clostridioides difficile CD200]
MELDLDLIKDIYDDWNSNKSEYDTMYKYYKGETDAISNYKMVTKRSNNKINTNFLKKFINEEVAYSLANKITYTSRSGDEKIINDLEYYTCHWSKKHDSDLLRYALLFGLCYELYYVKDDEIQVKIIKPTDGCHYENENGEIVCFIREFTKGFEDDTYVDVYDKEYIYHFDSNFKEVESPTVNNIFDGNVPISICKRSEELGKNTIFNDIKGLQDAYETNLSDISNEISDFRNAYLTFSGCNIKEDDLPRMKELGILQVNGDGKIEWLIKDMNDTFVQNTLSSIKENMYEITSHINHNEKMQSNTSSLAVIARLISTEWICSQNNDRIADTLFNRYKLLCIWLNKKYGFDYDYKDIKAKFTPKIPRDDLVVANILSQLGDKLSTETGLSQLSFIDNPHAEIEKAKKEQEIVSEGEILLDESKDYN